VELDLPDDLVTLQRTVRRYVDKRLQPLSKEVESGGTIPRDVLTDMGANGLFGVAVPEEFGGLGLGKLAYCIASEQLGRTNSAYWNVIAGSSGLACTAIMLGGSEALKRRYLPDLATATTIGAYALSEPGAGSDAASLRSAARRDGERYVLDGAKTFITNAPIADVFVVFVTVDATRGSKGITAFVLERDTRGLIVGGNDEKMGLHGSTTAQILFEELSVPPAQRLGEEGQGFKIALATLDFGRLGLAAHSIGAAQHLLEASVEYAKTRRQFGAAISANQAIQWMLADAATEIHASRLMLYEAATRADRGERVTERAAMTKLFATETLGRVADAAVQIHGGMGYMSELWIERAYRDARIARIYEGTSEIQRALIAARLLADN
jgi:acyl-CoA dehydrogenase